MILPLLVLASATGFVPAPRAELLDSAALNAALETLAAEHPERVRVVPVGASREGRPIQALRIGAPEDVPGRPAILVVANLEGPLVWTSALALELARGLAGAERDGVAELLSDTTVYVIPRANPDAAEARFRAPLAEVRASGHGVDDDRDGRNGEDDRGDVDGDGFVTTMRVLDPEGEWIEDPSDARLLVKADRVKGERGRYALHPEGLDDDGDGEVAEDPALDAELNSNFAFRWEELQPRAGRYPTDEPEVLALSEFVLAHPELALVLVFGEEDNLVREAAQAKSGRRGDESPGVHEGDAKLLGELGRRYREATKLETKGGEERAGSFAAWTYHHRGLVTLTTLPWSAPAELPKTDEKEAGGEEKREAGAEAALEEELVPAEEAAAEEAVPDDAPADDAPADDAPAEDAAQDDAAPAEKAPEPSEGAKRLAWLEAHGVADAFVAWKAFEHPTLGSLEIGGFRPYALLEPPPGELEALADKELAFLVSLGALLPRLALVELEAKALGAGLYEVTAALENDALMPFACAQARETRTVRPARVRLVLAEGAELIAGPGQTLVRELDGAGGRRELRWLVRAAGPDAILVEVDSDHAGSFALQPEGN